ncbi:RNA polymerase sigma-70 factor [Petrimonas sp.]|uniref:RNA polymerase sigma-70 factor n=1 Tax=Petrimonas sp. TaxID=2023866 RepID=UPI003F51297E
MHRLIIDEKSFCYYYDLYFNDLCKSLNYFTRDLDIIEDTVQNVFVNLWENRSTIDITHIKTYLFTSVRNRMLNYIRDNKNIIIPIDNSIIESFSTDNNDINFTFNEELYQVTQEAIATLPEKCKELFILSKHGNYTYKQIAENKNISIKTVENQISIALKKIRSYVSEKAILSFLLSIQFLLK